jgi:hypothetical protein
MPNHYVGDLLPTIGISGLGMETFGEFRPMELLLVKGEVTPGTSVSNCRKFLVGSGRASKLRELMTDESSELSLRTSGHASLTTILLVAMCNLQSRVKSGGLS